MVDKKLCVILVIAGLLCFTSIFMSLYSISTANWSTLGSYSIGLFQTCSNSQCIRNHYAMINYDTNSPPIFSKRFFNAAPLAIVGVFLQLIVCFLCFLTAFIYLPPKLSLTGYVTLFLVFIAFLFQFFTLTEASYGIHLNSRSAAVFEAALVLEVVIIILTTLGADRLHQLSNVQYV